MSNIIRSILIKQLVQSGWVEVIRLPIEEPEKATPENIEEAMNTIREYLYNGDKSFLSIKNKIVVFRGLDKGGTFSITASEDN